MPVQHESPGQGGQRVSLAVILAVSEQSGTDPTDLPPLYEAVDPTALDSFFESITTDDTRGGGDVRFGYAGYRVRVSVGRELDVTVTEEPD